ncbi:MAG TPA: Smr/MutS family protein [Gammaproteobacteria bacterium]|jgi:DNA-nicking Smr family endonuclease|nr:Smr/MutS family protein [Gammaproteobacteria bacterium]
MTKKNPPSEDAHAAFLEANPGMKPLKATPRIRVSQRPPTPTKRRFRDPEDEPDTTRPLFIDRDKEATLERETLITVKHSSISNKILRNLAKGQYNVEASLDMHGMTVAVAEREVDAFLKACLQRKLQVVLLIHGKGTHQQKPILKNKLYQWLSQVDDILAFCSAAPSQGHRGALVVLLKRKQEEKHRWTQKT